MNWYKRYLYAAIAACTADEFIHKLKMFGVEPMREGRGDHMIFLNKNNGNRDSVPMGPGARIINPITMKKILGHLDIPWGVWKRLPKRPKLKDMLRIENQLPWAKQEIPLEQPEPIKPKIPDWRNQQWFRDQQQYDLELG